MRPDWISLTTKIAITSKELVSLHATLVATLMNTDFVVRHPTIFRWTNFQLVRSKHLPVSYQKYLPILAIVHWLDCLAKCLVESCMFCFDQQNSDRLFVQVSVDEQDCIIKAASSLHIQFYAQFNGKQILFSIKYKVYFPWPTKQWQWLLCSR